MTGIVAVILCGGSGSRLWPLSRTLLPKQFLPLVSDKTMMQETVLRARALPEVTHLVIVGSHEHRFLVAEQLQEIGVTAYLNLLEPAGRNTAPAAAAAAAAVIAEQGDATLLVLPSDHLVSGSGFREAVATAARLALTGKLVAFGVKPTGPTSAYGYMRRGVPCEGFESAYGISEFVEKPDRERAQQFLTNGMHDWNSGMFVFGARRYLEELGKFRPDMLDSVERAVRDGKRDLDFFRLDENAFLACPADSIDYAVMEKTRDACMVSAGFSWSDIGSWSALWEVGPKDADGNVRRGDVYADQASGCYLRTESRLLVTIGVKDLVVVETDNAVLVAHKDRAQDVKNAVEQLKARRREEYFAHRRVYRPWGYFELLDSGERFQAKRLMLKPGARISLQLHRRRAEHWVVVSGKAQVTRGEEQLVLQPNESTYIPVGFKHRLENIGAEPLLVIEVQSGDYLGEDDIERFDDDYKRS